MSSSDYWAAQDSRERLLQAKALQTAVETTKQSVSPSTAYSVQNILKAAEADFSQMKSGFATENMVAAVTELAQQGVFNSGPSAVTAMHPEVIPILQQYGGVVAEPVGPLPLVPTISTLDGGNKMAVPLAALAGQVLAGAPSILGAVGGALGAVTGGTSAYKPYSQLTPAEKAIYWRAFRRGKRKGYRFGRKAGYSAGKMNGMLFSRRW